MENQLAKNKQSPRKRAINLLVHIILAVLAVAADMYEVRQVTLNGTQINPTTAQILGTYSTNLLPSEGDTNA